MGVDERVERPLVLRRHALEPQRVLVEQVLPDHTGGAGEMPSARRELEVEPQLLVDAERARADDARAVDAEVARPGPDRVADRPLEPQVQRHGHPRAPPLFAPDARHQDTIRHASRPRQLRTGAQGRAFQGPASRVAGGAILGQVDAAAQLEYGRRAFRRQAWDTAHASLSAADRAEPLAAADLELLATAAYLLGREDDYLGVLERAHAAHREAGDRLAAVRAAFWIGIHRARRGETGQAGGWLARAHRLLEPMGPDQVERGYLLLPEVFTMRAAGDWEGAAALAGEAVAIAERFGDADLLALAEHEQGHTLTRHGRLEEGLPLLDEAMLAATRGDLSPIVAGIVYCGAILACQETYEVGRAQEWTAALSQWCAEQPDLVAFTGRCLVHRAEILELRGDWSDALREARRAAERCQAGENAAAAGEAWYRQGEIHRLRGDHAAAEADYREADRRGREPQPGLALLRLAQGRRDAASAAIRRALRETTDVERIAVLSAGVEILCAAGSLGEAEAACGELEERCAAQPTPALEAMCARARGVLALAEGEAPAALAPLRRGRELWQQLDAPYEAARTRALAGVASRAVGDEEGAARERRAAEETLRRLAADPAAVDPLDERPRGGVELTERQLEVLRLVDGGATNREVAERLVLSEHTVARHLQNAFATLGVSSRTAALARARERGLL